MEVLQGAQFGFINIDLGNPQHPELEQKILDEVVSYGRQLGHIGDALDVIMRYLDRSKFTKEGKDALAVLEGDLARIGQIKQKVLGTSKPKAKESGRWYC